MFARQMKMLTLVGLLVLGVTLPAAGQDKKATAPAKSEPKAKRVEFGVEMRWRNEFRDNLDFKPADDFDGYTGQRIRIHMRAKLTPNLIFFVQGQDVWIFDQRNDKTIHDLATNLYQAYFDWKPKGSKRWELRAGRQEWIYGEERVLGAFGWDTVGRAFDAARVRYKSGAWSSDFFWGRVTNVRRAGAKARAGEQDLSGGYITRAPKDSPGKTEIYGLFLRDGLRTKGEIASNPFETVRIFTAGFRRVWQPKTGWRYSFEHAWQFGKRGPDAHAAAMVVATGGYMWGAKKWKPRVQAEYDFASGDGNPTDGKSHEFNNLFPTNHPFYGYADLVGLRNLHDLRFTAAATPHPKLTLEADYHHFWLATERGPWKNAGGRVMGFDPTGASGRNLGDEVDFTARVPVHKHLQLLGGFSVFVPGRFAERTRGSETHKWGYIQTLVRF
ncbi:MAG: alginate export family protein [Acidobacteria bacterium]|nr:alginate export family protein [Acidobacteriota bacterium]MBI3663031.1 alginate export family protein [Acidobacteriota bacterium]